MENPTWKFIFFAAILFQVAFSAPPPGPRPDLLSEIGEHEHGVNGFSLPSGNNDDLASLITNFLQGQGSSGSNYQGHTGYQNHPPPGELHESFLNNYLHDWMTKIFVDLAAIFGLFSKLFGIFFLFFCIFLKIFQELILQLKLMGIPKQHLIP